MKRAIKLDENGLMIDHRPEDHPGLDMNEWVVVDYSQEYCKMTLNELIYNRCGAIVNGSLFAREKNPVLATYAELRLRAYSSESDKLKVQADNEAAYDGVAVDYTEWRAKVKEIKDRFPKVA